MYYIIEVPYKININRINNKYMSILNRPGWLNQLALNEMRSSRHAGLLDLSIVQKQLADKKIVYFEDDHEAYEYNINRKIKYMPAYRKLCFLAILISLSITSS